MADNPWPAQQHQAQVQQLRATLAAARYHQALRVGGVAPDIRFAPPLRPSLAARQDSHLAQLAHPFRPQTAVVRPLRGGLGRPSLVARQDGYLANQAQAGERAQAQYHIALTNARTQQALAVRQAVARQAYMYADTRSDSERRQQQREQAEAEAYAKYRQNVELISGEFAPLVLYDPVIKSVAQGGLMTMGGVALPASLQWAGPSAWMNTGAVASYAALRQAPWQFAKGAFPRLVLDGLGQWGANAMLSKPGQGFDAWRENNWIETGMSGAGLNPGFIAVATGSHSYSTNNGFQAVWRSEESGQRIGMSRFLAQAGVGLTVSHFGGRVEGLLEHNNYRAWRSLNLSVLLRAPAFVESGLYHTLRFGQHYGPPLTFGLLEETGEGYYGNKADSLGIPKPPAHPDSPVFRDTPPKP